MNGAREEVLHRIRAAGAGPTDPMGRRYDRRSRLARPQLVDLFAERVADYRAEVRSVAAAALRQETTAVFRELGAERVGVPPGFPEEWRPDDIEIVEDRGLASQELDGLDGVLTACTVAIAETGTIVLAGGPQEGRRALTLVPDLHVCIVREAQVVGIVPEAITILDPLVRAGRAPLTFISGPSATSDIELSRVEGVHGPRTLVVIVVSEEDS